MSKNDSRDQSRYPVVHHQRNQRTDANENPSENIRVVADVHTACGNIQSENIICKKWKPPYRRNGYIDQQNRHIVWL